jgi:nitroreductase
LTRIIPAIRERRSVRRFKPDPVPKAVVSRCIAAARLAPSAENTQPWHFIVVDDPIQRDALAKKAFRGIYRVGRFLAAAPLYVVLLGKPAPVAHRLGSAFQGLDLFGLDLGIAGEHFVLQATEEGLGTCWIGWFDVKAVRSLLGVPKRTWRVAALFAVGYPADKTKQKQKRRSLGSLISWNRFGGKL